ncbi:MAG: winged-helix domain-containing protein [Chloroflexota bacterium]|nr:winged-helix domain-containing protein [Chloroflexota bacterium]
MLRHKVPEPSEDMSKEDMEAYLKSEGLEHLQISTEREASELLTLLASGERHKNFSLVLLHIASISVHYLHRLTKVCSSLDIATLAIVEAADLRTIDPTLEITDLISSPVKEQEFMLRAKRAVANLANSFDEDVIARDNLIINPTNYDVTVNNKRIHLRFKEYELLLLLASNPGRVYDRATLLSQIWGYDYFGGTRTVDVHIRRLRSKIEHDSDNPFIETIWNVGYRFRTMD